MHAGTVIGTVTIWWEEVKLQLLISVKEFKYSDSVVSIFGLARICHIGPRPNRSDFHYGTVAATEHLRPPYFQDLYIP